MLIERAEVEGRVRAVRIDGGRIVEVAERLDARPGEPRLDAQGGALLPGLHDHHIHLLAAAAAAQSVRCGPPQVPDADALARVLRAAPAVGGMVRGVGYHESVAGPLERRALDALAGGRAVRVQHRSGACWQLSSAALEQVGAEAADHPGVERDASGRATGRLFRMDDWLADRLGRREPDLASLSRRLLAAGLTGVTDATADNDAPRIALLRAAVERGDLAQRVVAMGGDSLTGAADGPVGIAQRKLLLDERDPPDPDALAERVRSAHRAGRGVALHCTTRAELVLGLAALRAAGPHAADRIEHASVAPPELVREIADLGVCVVAQPGFVFERGDAYLADVDERDRPWLCRARAFLDAGVPLGGSSDAPFGEPDPWAAIRTAVSRRTRAGRVLGADEALDPARALALFTTSPDAPGGAPRRVAPGAAADLCLLDVGWAEACEALGADRVRATFVGGVMVHLREDGPASA